ncbi:hypothetical protein ACHAXR_011541 [Thalassiosira sp. AJA248-18]
MRCSEVVVTRTKRSVRIIFVALVFVASYFLLDQLHPVLVLDSVQYSNTSAMIHHDAPKSKIHIFYNLFTKSSEDEERVRRIVDEQFGHIDATLHDTNVSITSIGHKLSSIPNNSFIKEHYNEGGEDLTLHAVWQYCKANNHKHAKVVYLHSKGSFHPNESNHRLRNFVTQGALSAECANLPDTCNVCSSRMSPLPHPHTSGNMWLARCDYIAQLIDPLALKDGKLPNKFHEDNPCKGRGRYLGEHWVHSHPSVMPCDLYPGKEFTWAHLRVPSGDLRKELRRAPRFRFDEYVLPGMCLSEHPETLSINDFVELRKQNYEMLYNITDLEESWWGWEFLQRSIASR